MIHDDYFADLPADANTRSRYDNHECASFHSKGSSVCGGGSAPKCHVGPNPVSKVSRDGPF